MLERDRLLPSADPQRNDHDLKLYIVTPTPMMGWMEQFKKDQCVNRPDLLELIPSTQFNPESYYYYQSFSGMS
jgi:hypothetical protein